VSGNISLGGTLSQKLLLGVSTNGWTKSESGSSLTVAGRAVFRDPRVLRR